MNKKKIIAGLIAAPLAIAALSGCTSEGEQYRAAQNKANQNREPYTPSNGVELNNYNRAQELYDDPAAIQWCTAFPSSATAPIVTIPIAGKLTTSATSYFKPVDDALVPQRSVDGMYHGDSFYRYGFTPAGVYVDFSNSMEMICQTSLTEYQKTNTYVDGASITGDVDARQDRAEEALRNGDGKGAAKILEGN